MDEESLEELAVDEDVLSDDPLVPETLPESLSLLVLEAETEPLRESVR